MTDQSRRKPEFHHRRQAVEIVAQLPENVAEALLVLEAATELVVTFLDKGQAERLEPRPVLAFESPSSTADKR